MVALIVVASCLVYAVIGGFIFGALRRWCDASGNLHFAADIIGALWPIALAMAILAGPVWIGHRLAQPRARKSNLPRAEVRR